MSLMVLCSWSVCPGPGLPRTRHLAFRSFRMTEQQVRLGHAAESSGLAVGGGARLGAVCGISWPQTPGAPRDG